MHHHAHKKNHQLYPKHCHSVLLVYFFYQHLYSPMQLRFQEEV